jgi:hypothetical protein
MARTVAALIALLGESSQGAVGWPVAWPSSRRAHRALRASRFGGCWAWVDGHRGIVTGGTEG